MDREKVIETVQELPNEFDLDQLIDKLIFIEKVEKGLTQLEEGKTKSHDYVKQASKTWSIVRIHHSASELDNL